MRTLVFAATLLPLVAGCIHLPPDVAAVVREADRPARNNFVPELPPARAADDGRPSGSGTWRVEADAERGAGTLLFKGIPVRSGQVLVSEQGSARGMFLSLLVADSSPWVHTGILVVEDGRPVVYEANGRLRPSFGSAPLTRNVIGGVRRLDFDSFLEQNRFVALYDPPAGTDRDLIGRFARDSFMNGLAFDPYFDRGDPSTVYCSEFTALALAAGSAPPAGTSPMNPNASVAVILAWLGITTPDIIPPAALIADGNRVGLFSRRDSPAQVQAWFAVKAELHRRFTPEQKLGNVLSFSPLRGFRFQPEVAAFMAAANTAATDWSDLPPGEIDQRVRALATVELGPFQPAQVTLD